MLSIIFIINVIAIFSYVMPKKKKKKKKKKKIKYKDKI